MTVLLEFSCPNCPNCDRKAAKTTSRKRTSPKPGNLCVCVQCGAISEFDNKKQLVLVEASKLEAVKKQQPETYQVLMETSSQIKSILDNLKIN